MAEEDNKTTEETTPTEAVEETPAEETKAEADAPSEPAEEVVTEEEPAPAEAAEESAPEEPAEEVKRDEAAQKIVPGMVVRVHLKIKETTPRGDERERIQVFEGTVIAKKGQDRNSATITVRKVSKGFGVERIFPLAMPTIEKIEVVKRLRVRRSKLYFLRGIFKKRLKEMPIERN
ncbi:MAG: 50S ribosomal protein L19 [bacterium]